MTAIWILGWRDVMIGWSYSYSSSDTYEVSLMCGAATKNIFYFAVTEDI
jgi:hypothetical protein